MHSTYLGVEIPFRLKPLLLPFFFPGFRARSVFFLYRLVYPAASTATWMPVRDAPVATFLLYIQLKN
jgi:hypothetical protein